MIALKSLLSEKKYDTGCVMAQIPPLPASQILNFGKEIIPDNILYFDPTGEEEYGREDRPHVTIKFGLTQSYTKEQIQEFLKGTKPFPITVHGLDIFSNEKFDVVKLNVDGPELRRLREIFDKLPNVDEYKEYRPHMTLAYVQAGHGVKYQGKILRKFSKILVDTIKYSDRGNELFIKLS